MEMIKRCAFLSMNKEDLEAFYAYDDMVFEPLAALGWQAEEISWRQSDVDWDQYDLVVIRSCWDYQQDVDNFLASLRNIEASRAILHNPISTVEWNVNKTYLAELARAGVPIVPSIWRESANVQDIQAALAYFATDTVIIKPQVSANSDYTYKLTLADMVEQSAVLNEVFSSKPSLMQPFIESVVTEGEYSLFYFNGAFSHAILKKPKHNDFRVQEEHGGQLVSVEPESALLEAAQRVMAKIPDSPLYARVDLVRGETDWLLMEVELIEPSLYFNMDSQSAARFAQAIHQRFGD